MEITTEKLLDILKKNFIFILIVAVLFSALAFIVTKFFIKPTYKANISLYVDTPIDTNLSIDQVRKVAQTYILLLDTNAFCDQVLTSVGTSLSENYSASQLKKMVEYTILNNTEVFDVVVTAKSSNDAFVLANAIAAIAPERVKQFKSDVNLGVVQTAVEENVKKPASPNLQNNIIIGALLGIIFSFGLVFLKEMFDVRIKNADEITSRYHIPILGGVPIFYNEMKNGKGSTANGR